MKHVIKTGTQYVASAGTAEALQAASKLVTSVLIVRDPGNAGTVYIGDSTVDSTSGIPLTAEVPAVEITPQRFGRTAAEIDLADIYVDAATNADGVIFSYTTENN